MWRVYNRPYERVCGSGRRRHAETAIWRGIPLDGVVKSTGICIFWWAEGAKMMGSCQRKHEWQLSNGEKRRNDGGEERWRVTGADGVARSLGTERFHILLFQGRHPVEQLYLRCPRNCEHLGKFFLFSNIHEHSWTWTKTFPFSVLPPLGVAFPCPFRVEHKLFEHTIRSLLLNFHVFFQPPTSAPIFAATPWFPPCFYYFSEKREPSSFSNKRLHFRTTIYLLHQIFFTFIHAFCRFLAFYCSDLWCSGIKTSQDNLNSLYFLKSISVHWLLVLKV